MAPRIPEGFVFVPRQQGVNVALQLLDAAEAIGADRVASVRSTTTGYHVHRDVAEKYVDTVGDEAGEIIEVDEPVDVQPPASDNPTTDDVLDALNSGLINDEDLEEIEEEEDENSDSTETPESTGEEEEEEEQEEEIPELGVTVDSKREEIDAYGANLTPPVDTTKAANKAEAIEILEHARTAPKTDAE